MCYESPNLAFLGTDIKDWIANSFGQRQRFVFEEHPAKGNPSPGLMLSSASAVHITTKEGVRRVSLRIDLLLEISLLAFEQL